MKPIKQTILHTETTQGNCLQAALASILELQLSEVPVFEGDSWYLQLMNWLEDSHKIELIRWDYEVHFKGYYLVTGQSPRGEFKHMVVYQNSKMAHDPHPDNTGLVKIESTWLLVPFSPANGFKKYETSIALLKEWEILNSEACSYDHHGNCQTHFLQEDCVYKRTWDFLKGHNQL